MSAAVGDDVDVVDVVTDPTDEEKAMLANVLVAAAFYLQLKQLSTKNDSDDKFDRSRTWAKV